MGLCRGYMGLYRNNTGLESVTEGAIGLSKVFRRCNMGTGYPENADSHSEPNRA